ncbi:MAG: RIP metalloprotease RseP [Pseudomonadota bacterium]
MNMLTSLFAFLLLLGVLITFHEYGHFCVARYFGVHVRRFSIGMGPVICRYVDRHGTEFAISAIPLGGYVHFLDEAAPNNLKGTLEQQPLRNRAAIVLAGPAFNFILAILVYWAIFIYGIPEFIPKLDTPRPNTPAYQAGLHKGDEIVAIDHTPVHNWSDARVAMLDRIADPSLCPVVVKRAGETLTVNLSLSGVANQESAEFLLDEIGLTALQPNIPAKLSTIYEDTPADRAGLQTGDIIRAVDGQPVHWADLVRIIHDNPNKTLALTVERKKQQLTIPITLAQKEKPEGPVGSMGVAVAKGGYPKDSYRHVSLRPDKAFTSAVTQVATYARLTLEVIGKMVIGAILLLVM